MAVKNHPFRMVLTKDYTPPKGFQQVDATNFWRDWIKRTMTTTDTTTRCKECLLYYSVRIDDGGSISQWVRETEGGSWKPMPDEIESNLGIADHETNYTCWLCKNEMWR